MKYFFSFFFVILLYSSSETANMYAEVKFNDSNEMFLRKWQLSLSSKHLFHYDIISIKKTGSKIIVCDTVKYDGIWWAYSDTLVLNNNSGDPIAKYMLKDLKFYPLGSVIDSFNNLAFPFLYQVSKF